MARTRRSGPDRALDLLARLAAAGPEGAGFAELARHLAASNAVLARLLRRLAAGGWLRRDAAGRYHPGPALTALAPVPRDAATLAGPVLRSLRDQTRCTVLLIAEEPGPGRPVLRCLAKAAHEDSLGMQEVGSLRTAYLNYPWGWCLLAGHDAATARRIIREQDDADAFAADHERGRAQLAAQGWCALARGGWIKMAAPVPDTSGRPRLALGLGLHAAEASRQKAIGRELLAGAAALARDLAAPLA